MSKVVKSKPVKRQDSNRTKESKFLSIERRSLRVSILRNGGRF